VQEAWNEYQDELATALTTKHAIRIQAFARGMQARSVVSRVKLQEINIVIIQAHMRANIARKLVAKQRKQRIALSLFKSNKERRFVQKLELLWLAKKERQRAAAANVLQGMFHVRKANVSAKVQRTDELRKRRLLYLWAEGESKFALRIQLAWWQYRVYVLNQRKEVERKQVDRGVMDQVAAQVAAEAERAARALEHKETLMMAETVGKKARSKPLGFQPKHLKLVEVPNSLLRALAYCKYDLRVPQSQERRKSVPLERATGIVQHSSPEQFLLLVTLAPPPAVRKAKPTTYTFKLKNREVSDVWLKHMRAACPHLRDTAVTVVDSV